MVKKIVTLVVVSFLFIGCNNLKLYKLLRNYENPTANSSAVDTTVTNITTNIDNKGQEAKLLSAFYGLDDDLGRLANMSIGKGAGGADGMPVIFSHEIDPSTLQPGDFKVTTASGKIGDIFWVTLAPADDIGELRTVLFAGDYGSITDQPVKVEVIGNILSLDGKLNFKGASIDVIPLEDGPTIIFAEVVPKNQWNIDRKSTELPWGGSSGVPKGTNQAVRVTWAGGVTKPGGKEIDEQERALYVVAVLQDNGDIVEVTPFEIADLGDGDNNHLLCLNVSGKPISVYFPEGHLTDPREDLNPETSIKIQY